MTKKSLPHLSLYDTHKVVWSVWYDTFQQEVLGIESACLSNALRAALFNEHCSVHEVLATNRAAAVRKVFPEYFLKADQVQCANLPVLH